MHDPGNPADGPSRLDAPRVYSFGDITPVIEPGAFVHPTAVLIGDVIVATGCYVGPGAAMRGDFGRIELRRGANLQDNCVVHSHWAHDCILEPDSHIGHGAVIHACHIGRDALVGMNAVVLDEAYVGDEAVVAAMAFVKAGAQVPSRALFAGIPGRVVRMLSDEEVRNKHRGTELYQELARRCLAELRPARALASVEPQRRRYDWGGFRY